MAQKEDSTKNPQSAPELPPDLVKKFGLHQDEHTDELPTKATAPDSPVVDNSKTDAAVDDILAKESDELLAAQDAEQHTGEPAAKRGVWRGIGHFFVSWWRNKWARTVTILLLVGAVTAIAVLPAARYAVLNGAGVRSSASVTVIDNTTQLPLKNVTVALGDMRIQTNRKGVATFSHLKLGEYNLSIKRIAFAGYEQKVTVGWGSNPLGTVKLKATGLQYTLLITDYISGRPIPNAEASSDEVNALSDKNGKVILTVDDTDVATLSVTVRSGQYRSESVELTAATSDPTNVILVPDQKDIFVSKQRGTYDVYAVDLDGKNQKVLLAGTGSEGAGSSLVVAPDGSRAALVSTRDNLRDSDGYVLSSLTIIDIQAGTSHTVDRAEQIQLVDWIDNRLVYRSTTAGASASDPQRNRLVSYNYESNARAQLATANQFNTIMSARGFIYYAVSSTDQHATLGLFKIKSDGTGRNRLSEDEVWTGVRSTYNTFSLQTPESWYTYAIKDEQFSKSSAPATLTAYSFVEDSEAKQSAWTDVRDGKGTLLLYDIEKDKHKTLISQGGLTSPLRWAGEKVIIYRVSTTSETADYAISPEGGEAHKIADVTGTYGYAPVY